ncbi:Ribosomal RNA-processing protein 8 like protein [Argiope bruennichi]|uniref:Ribosomal RNA-processing protein 8 n=1 Tax=Argiope bruennichi TaxID=94029 RepID=A0A8T0FL89_ARGBR|nr:Ribosomal RNA-processing protein 8 like protein [Argiope bruennichi]
MDSSVTALKSSKKRKKHPAENSSNDTLKKKKTSRYFDHSREFVKKKKSFGNKNIKSQASNSIDIQKSNKTNESMSINMAKKFKKKKVKTGENIATKSSSVTQSKHVQTSKKNKKFKVPGCNIQSSPTMSKKTSASAAVKKVSKLKKGKKKLGKFQSNLDETINSESDENLSELCISDDNESDEEVLREEIQNSSIFKQIEKLMKKAPHLNPANAGAESSELLNDEDMDNSSELSLSVESDDEDSVMETDDEGASSSESDIEDSGLKNEVTNKKNNPAKKQDKNVCLANKKYNFTESVAESTGFNRTSKDKSLKRDISNKEKKGQMSSNLKNKVQEKLAGAKFRFLNEKLYTETGKEAFKYFQENTEEFEDYHSGYRLQVSKWPINPVNEIIAAIQKLKKSFVIADLGCGEAKIAQTFPDRTIHSFDLVRLNEFVKACDISKLPLPNESVDVAIFCLSLMGTNLKDYLCETFRILKVGGILKIAEVESRIEDLGHFINYLKSIGFTLERKNTKHKMFVFLDLKKEKQKCKLGKVPSLSLKPCLYKKR